MTHDLTVRQREELKELIKEANEKEQQDETHWRIQGGATSMCPPNRINFFRFHIRFHQKVYVLEVGTP